MVKPKVSILWLNYNSSHFIDIVLESLQGIKDLDYPNYELIAVDNCSTDGSYQIIKAFLEKIENAKLIRAERNLGFTGGSNIAYRARDPKSKYVVLLNNDAIPFPNSLVELVEYAEQNEKIGATQGIILDLETGRIDTAGDMVNELMTSFLLYRGEPPQNVSKKYT